MRETIKQIADQSQMTVSSLVGEPIKALDPELFAENIIKVCAGLVKQYQLEDGTNCGDIILNHWFGQNE